MFWAVFIFTFIITDFSGDFYSDDDDDDEYHHADEDDVCPSYSSPAITTSAGRGVLWETCSPNNRLNSIRNSSAPSYIPDNNSCKLPDVFQQNRSTTSEVKDSTYRHSRLQQFFSNEERDLRKKEVVLYIAALNGGRPRHRRKIQKLPKVGYLPTVFE